MGGFMIQNLEGQVAIVTGGTGFRRSLCRRLKGRFEGGSGRYKPEQAEGRLNT